MPRVYFRATYIHAYKRFTKRNAKRVEIIDEALRQFAKNPKHPSFHLEKLSGGNYWTVRIDSGNRMFFVWSDEGDTAIFFYIGPHDSYKTMKLQVSL